MLLNLATKIFGSSNERLLKGYHKDIDRINEYEEEYQKLSDSDLQHKTSEFRDRLKNGETEKDLLHEAFAVVREASKRTLGLRHFDVQMLGGMVLNNNQIAEMHTGEGKTLVATLPVYLNALSGKGVHVVTVNDYLAQRDAKWMSEVYNFLGLSVGCIVGDTTDEGRKQAYKSDVTYGTNNEFGFDYLRDNMKYSPADIVQKPFNFAIVDEVDSILIDEARTPLIISGPSESDIGLYSKVDKVIPSLISEDYEIDEKMKTVIFTDEGIEHIENLLKESNLLTDGELYDPQNISLVHHSNQALRAHKMFSGDTDYIVKDGKVILIDEFTGRMMDGRRLSDGLHQAIEAKENVEIQNENQTLASVTFQNYFRMYPKLSGMTGTALTEATEFMEIYKLGVISVPSNVEITRIDHDDKIYRSFDEKIGAIVNVIDEAQKIKQPVLIGTVSIEKSELLSSELKKRKIKHKVLNARHHEQESQIIAQAGQPSAVTIATNMAGRGTDIQLGGNLDMIIDNTVDPDLSDAKRAKAIDKIKAEVAVNHDIVIEAGGLFVIGTERHESRRVDNQLRGRSGRQGDPGETIFFLSTQDDLMRIFSPDALEKVLGSKAVGLKEGESLTHPWLTKALQRAQARVEQQNFEMRKTLLKFDDVMNDQRRVIYQQRRDVMNSADITELVTDMRYDVIDEMVDATIPEKAYPDQWDTETLEKEVARVLHLDLPISDWAQEEGIADEEIIDRITDASNEKMKEKADKGGSVFLQIQKSMMLQTIDQNWKEHLLNLDHLRQGINLRAFAQKDPLNEYKTEAFVFFEKMLESLKESIVHDLSLVEINFDEETLIKMMEARRAQQDMKRSRNDPALAGSPEAQQQGETQEPIAPKNSGAVPFRREFDQENPETWSKIGRNAPCPCGSGKKYKQCHGKVAA